MDIVCLGEALIDFVALESGVAVGEASGFVKAPGGAPANVAVGAARLGARTAFLGKVGDDPFGLFLRDTLAAAGVDTGGLRLDAQARTGLAFVSLRADGERSFCFFRNPSADMLYRPDDVDIERIRAGRVFHFGSITLIDEPARGATRAAVRAAREAGCLVSLDPNLRPALWPSLDVARAAILDALPTADLVKVSDEELEFLTGETDVERAMRVLSERFPSVELLVVTRGAAGCLWRTSSGVSGSTSGYGVDAVDTTGAGDGFVAGMLVALLPRLALGADVGRLDRAALDAVFARANAVGALTTTAKGAIPALPTAGQVDRFVQDYARGPGN